MNLKRIEEPFNALCREVETTPPALFSVKLSDETWSLKEIIGHLVDSAANNHQRFVRLMISDKLSFPYYEAESWISAQNYADFDAETLVALWVSLNRLLIHIAEQADDDVLTRTRIRADSEISFGNLIVDYYAHMQIHLNHYRERLTEVRERNRE